MRSREERIQGLLLNEIAHKSVPATITFSVFAIFVFFYRFTIVDLALPLRVACFGVIAASTIRILTAKKMIAAPEEKKNQLIIRFCVWLNTVSWAVIFGCASWELQCTGFHFTFAMIMLEGFVAASIITLSYDKWCFVPFNVALLAVPSVIGASLAVMTGENSYYLIPLFFGFSSLYQFRQFSEYRKILHHRFATQVDLEDSNKALKESQETLITQTIKLVQASKSSALGEMAGGLSHEVNNSLMTILGNIQQLQRRLKAQNLYSEENERRFDRTNEAIQKIKTVIEGLKYFSRESEKAPMLDVPLSEVIERSLNYCQELIKAHGITLILDEVPKGTVRGHPMELTQVLFGIIKNADEAVLKSPEHSDHWIRLSYQKSDRKIFILISNGGPLIDEKIRDKLFQPFFTTKDVNEGTGLSLSIAQGVVREHGGDLILDDCENHTCFRIELPLVD